MRKLVTISVLFVFAFLLAGQFLASELVLQVNRNAMMQTVKSGNEDSRLEAICLSREDAKALIDGNEITWNKKRYDIAWMEQKGDQVIVHALSDNLEENLLTALDDNFSGFCSNKVPGPKQNSCLDSFFKEYIPGNHFKLFENHNVNLRLAHTFLYSEKVEDGYSLRLLQPPIAVIS